MLSKTKSALRPEYFRIEIYLTSSALSTKKSIPEMAKKKLMIIIQKSGCNTSKKAVMFRDLPFCLDMKRWIVFVKMGEVKSTTFRGSYSTIY